MTQVTLFGGKPVTMNDEKFAQKLQQNAQDGGRQGDISYMSFSGKMGRYSIGAEKREPANDATYERWIVNALSFEDGWMCWKEGKPRARRMSNIFDGVPVDTPDMDEFGPFDKDGDGWSRAKGFVLKSVDVGEQASYTTSSVSGVAAVSDLQSAIMAQITSGEAARWPVIGLDMEAFEANGYKNFKPVFKIVGWLTDEDMSKIGEAEDDDEILAIVDETVGDLEVEGARKTAKKTRAALPEADGPESGSRRRARL